MAHRRYIPVAALVACFGAAPLAADVQVNIGIPAAPQVLASPQPFVAVPDVPDVRYSPDNPLDVFFYRNRYYAWQDGWFVTPRPGEPSPPGSARRSCPHHHAIITDPRVVGASGRVVRPA